MNTQKKPGPDSIALLKEVLAHLREPQALNVHPWAIQSSAGSSPGELLVQRLTGAFRKMLPPTPPYQGKRLDTRWAVFGMLAAQFFAPLLRSEPFPASLRQAWEKMDASILFFVYGRLDGLTDIELARVRFAGNEPEPPATSTLSDWHRKGLEQLAGLLVLEQERLTTRPAPIPARRTAIRWVGLALALIILFLTSWLGWKTWNLVQRLRALEQNANALAASLSPQPELKNIPAIAGQVHALRLDLDALQLEVAPFLWLAPYSTWVPQFGGTLSQAVHLLALAQNLAVAADEGLVAVSPAVDLALSTDKPLEVIDLLLQLQSASPQLLNAQIALALAQEARAQIDAGRLIPQIKDLITSRLDPLFLSISSTFPMEDALTLVRIAPKLLGVGQAGPQTYLILIQNEDELRPTGGFLTAVGSAVVKDGELLSIKIESAEFLDDYSKPYPRSPWQFAQFMNVQMLTFRDSNWFTDFPTTAAWAEYFYSYTRSSSADGVIAIDAHVIARLLQVLGPIRVDEVDFPITSENVRNYMRTAKESRPPGFTGKIWDRKQFIAKLAQPLLEKILLARGPTWSSLLSVLTELLAERHILLQFDDEQAATLLQRRAWDGALRPPANSDFLMLVDANMGYNKSNAIMTTALQYSVDLLDLTSPSSLLLVQQTNQARVDAPCQPQYTSRFIRAPAAARGEIPDYFYPIDECYWGYLRLYLPAGAKLMRSNPRQVPAESTMLRQVIPARTDDLGSEDLPGVQVVGQLVLTPTRASTTTEFELALPPAVLTRDDQDGSWVYRLTVQKQPGTLAHPFTLTLRLPPAARLASATVPLTENGDAWTSQLDLRRDLLIEVRFSLE